MTEAANYQILTTVDVSSSRWKNG